MTSKISTGMASRTHINDLMLRNLPVPTSGQVQYADGKIPGFGVRVTSAGVKSFYLTYRADGRSRRLTLGRYPYTSLADARAMAHEALVSIARGTDPQVTERRTPTFEAGVESFVETHCRQRNRPSTAAETERLLRTVFVPLWKTRELTSFDRREVLAILDPLVNDGKPSAANHAFAAIRKFFNWCVERGELEISPCTGLKPPTRPVSRDHVLTDDELQRLWQASKVEGYPFGTIFQLLALTAQRRGEVVGMLWSELDLKAATWTMSGARTKNGQPHIVPLTARVREILSSVPRTSEAAEFVFPARGKPDRPYSGYSKGKRDLDALAELHDWTLHDLRRTAATGMARFGAAPHVIERLLNHVSGSFGGVAGVYNRFQYQDEMRAALELWEAHIGQLTSGYETQPL